MSSATIRNTMTSSRRFESKNMKFLTFEPPYVFYRAKAVLGFCAFTCALAASAETTSVPQLSLPSGPAALSVAPPGTAQLPDEVRRELGEAACDADTQCRSIGIGVRPCGGPEAYLAWSSKVSDRARMTALVAKYNDDRRLKNQRSDIMSDCRVIPDPGAVCRPRAPDGQRVCQVGQGGQGRLD